MSKPRRSPVPPAPQVTTPPSPLSRLWSNLPPLRQREVLLLLSHLIAKNLPPVQRKEADHEHS